MTSESAVDAAAAAGGDPIWTDAERAAWLPVEKLKPSDWAEQNRFLTKRQSDIPGPWRNANNPPLKVIMDLCVRRSVNEIWLRKGVQIGGSDGIRNVIGCKAHQTAEPALLVLPNEKDGKKIIRKRIIPLFEDTVCLRELRTSRAHDKTLTAITLSNGFDLQLGWSGSASSLASDPFKNVFLDEVDKYDRTNLKEAPPVELARARTTRFEDDYLLVGWSTPTTADGVISVEFEDCPIKLYYWVPCPHCGKFQRFTRDALKWDDSSDKPGASIEAKHRAARVLARKSAWFECVGCKQPIRDREHKADILWRGCWATEDFAWRIYTADGHEEGEKPDGNKVGIHYPSCYSMAVSWPKIAAMTIAAGGDPGKLRSIRQNIWAEPWQELVSTVRVSVFEAKSAIARVSGFVSGVIPRWAAAVLMTVDTQIDHFWYVIRAWGQGYRSRRLHHGQAASFADLAMISDQRFWKYEGDVLPARRVDLIAIDSGGGKDHLNSSRTDQVYRWCNDQPLRRRALKGSSRPMEIPWRYRTIPYTPKDGSQDPYLVQLMLVDSQYFNDILATAITQKVPTLNKETGEVDEQGADLWELNNAGEENGDPEYNRHLANMHKVSIAKKRGGGKRLSWEGASDGARFDLRMCEVYQWALAYGPAAVNGLPSTETMIAAQQQAPASSRSQFTNPLTSHKGKW